MSGYIGTTDINSPQRKLATSYGIIPNDTTRSQGIINNVTSCFRGYAATLPDCTDPSSQECPLSACATFLNSSTSMTFLDPLGEQGLINGTGMYSCVRAFCNYISDRAIVNVDIGGIGVYISYITQVSIILVAWMMLKVCDLPLGDWSQDAFRRLRRQFHSNTPIEDGPKLPTHHKDCLIESLVEFQKAQCFFMSSVQIAALISTKRGNLQSDTLQQVQNNAAFLNVLSIGGFLPVTFLLFILYNENYRSWYTVILTLSTVALSAATFFVSSGTVDTPSAPLQIYQNCGNISPVAYCFNGLDLKTVSEQSIGAVLCYASPLDSFIYSVAVLFVLFLTQCRVHKLWGVTFVWDWLSKERWTCDDGREVSAPGGRCFWPVGFLKVRSLKDLLLGTINSGIVVGFIFFVALYIRTLWNFGNPHTRRVPLDLYNWSFGQIVAVTVWVAPVAQYIYLEKREWMEA